MKFKNSVRILCKNPFITGVNVGKSIKKKQIKIENVGFNSGINSTEWASKKRKFNPEA